MSLENDLKSIGLGEKEAKVYLSALELGPTNIQNLAQKSEIKRSTVYEMIKNLKEQGLISETTKGKRKIFIASEPENLKRSIKSKEQLLNDILPELKSINNTGTIKPKITFYEGREELKDIFHDTLKSKNKMAYWISPIKSINETVGEDFLNKYVESRTKKNIWVKSIHITSKKENYKYLEPQFHKQTLRDMRFTPVEIDIPNTIAIWDNKVAIMSSRKEGFGFIIESEDYTQTMKVFHELLWNISKPYGEMNFNKKEENIEFKEIDEEEEKKIIIGNKNMNIAITSDIHNNEVNLKKVLDCCKREKVEKIICCGDLASLETLDCLNDNFSGEIYFVFGNMDDGYLKKYPFEKKYKNTLIFKNFGETKIENKSIAFTHYPEEAEKLAQTGKYNFVFHGHTHRPWTEKIHNATVLNPGNVAGEIYPPTFAVWNTETDHFDLIRVHELK